MTESDYAELRRRVEDAALAEIADLNMEAEDVIEAARRIVQNNHGTLMGINESLPQQSIPPDEILSLVETVKELTKRIEVLENCLSPKLKQEDFEIE